MEAMAFARCLALVTLMASTSAAAAPPELYHQGAYESPVSGAPDDLLLLAGYGLAADDTVVYRAMVNGAQSLAPPPQLPSQSSEDLGLAPIVSAEDVPYSLTIKLPQAMRPRQPYALWVRTARGEWSSPVMINDARPLWFSPAFVYATGVPASLPRELKIVGRNLWHGPGQSMQVKLTGPSLFTGAAMSGTPSSGAALTGILEDYVARVSLPTRLAPGKYRVGVSLNGTNWVDVGGQSLEVLADPPTLAQFSVSDPQFGAAVLTTRPTIQPASCAPSPPPSA